MIPPLPLEEAQRRLLAGVTPLAAEAVDDRFRALVLTAAFGGLRFGELAALTRSRVDLDAATITVTETLVEVPGALLLGPPKSDAGRRSFPSSSDTSRPTSRPGTTR